MNLIPKFWLEASSKRKRIYSIAFMFIISLLVTVAGTFVQISQEEAQAINDQLDEIRASDTLALDIFVNNVAICLLMFIPVVGTAAGLFVLFSTGIAISAQASLLGYPPLVVLFALMLTPIFWIEFAAYSTGLTEGVWLFRRLWQRRWRELKWYGVLIGISVILLVIGAIVEAVMIQMA
jgi:uncharacterized membrane protein SpoIIM required for sporulation